MAKCSECIHCNVCKALIETGLPYIDEKLPADAFCMEFEPKSRFVELPCAVGDTVYKLHTDNLIPTGELSERMVCGVGIEYVAKLSDSAVAYFNDYDIGKTVFLTREEAENALKEMGK